MNKLPLWKHLKGQLPVPALDHIFDSSLGLKSKIYRPGCDLKDQVLRHDSGFKSQLRGPGLGFERQVFCPGCDHESHSLDPGFQISSPLPFLRVPTSASKVKPSLARAFPIAAAKVWNSLPTAITSLPTVHSFRRALKTELFVRSFGSARHRL